MPVKAHIDPVPAEAQGQRATPRRELLLETSGTLSGGVEANVTVHNISLAGLLIETAEPLGEGEVFQVDLPEAGAVDARVVWKSGELYGCGFERALGNAALAATQLRAPVNPTFIPRSGRTIAEPLGLKLNRLRRERGMTLADIADALGVSKPTVWAWEKSKARPVPSRIPDIAKALGVSVQDLGEAAPANEASAVTEECRMRIASAHGTDPTNVRIMIEV